MLQQYKHIYKTRLPISGRPPVGLPPAILSADNANCGDELPNNVFVQTSVSGVITDNDVVYQDSAGLTVFAGSSRKYLISVDGGTTIYSVTINGAGVILVLDICEEPVPRVFAELSAGYVSDTEISCGTPTDTYDVFLEMQNPLQITEGDVVYNLASGGTVFNGFLLAYNINIPSLLPANKKANIYINFDGVVSIVDLCLL